MICFSTIGVIISIGAIIGFVVKGRDIKDFYKKNKLFCWIVIILILRSAVDFNC